MKFIWIRLLLMALILNLCGCSIANEQFDCKYGKGVGCRSITEVNGMVNQGTLGSNNIVASTKTTPRIQNVKTLGSDVERVTEEHLRIWVAPFQDEQGRFHEGSIIHTVLRPGFWQMVEGA